MGGPGQPMPGRMMGGAPPTGSMPPMMGPRHPGAPNGMCEYAIRIRLPDPTQPESVLVCPILKPVCSLSSDPGPSPVQPDGMPPASVGPQAAAPARVADS